MVYDKKITITTGASRKATQWLGQTMMLSDFYARLKLPERGEETLAEYMAMPKGQQDERKDKGGFVGGQLSGPRRKASAVAGRDLITLDLDNIPAGGTDPALKRLDSLGCGYCVYSTRKHMPAAPRLRVIFPLSRTCTADEYEPLARRMGEYVGMELCDQTTFEAVRLMYWPSCCKDSEYIYHCADRALLSVDGLLDTYEDWHDITAWPALPGMAALARPAAKQGDPLAKSGVVGAFCKTYDIEGAMAAFLPGVYLPADGAPGRFTFTGGSTTGGAVLYDEGKFLYSHHATDPCSGKLVNAFDLVRLHRFGDLDDNAAPGTPVNRLPSYAAMAEAALGDPQVAGLLMDERWGRAKDAFQPVPGPEAPAIEEDDGAWRRPPMMEIDAQGKPIKSMKNLRTLLEHDPKLKGRLRLNLFSGRIDLVGSAPWKRPSGSATWNDEDAAQLRIYLEPFFGKLAKNDVLDAVAAAASDQAYHPVRDYLNGLSWDGAPRLDRLLVDYLGAEDCQYTREVTRKAFVAAVARAMAPGCKYDTMLVLVGGQGRHKSTLLAKMGGAWFSDSLRTFGDKDAMETIQGTWIDEVAEMQAMAKAEVDAVKMFLSKTSDYYRAAYGRYTVDRPRQCVFFGTTNSKECLTDTTGSRRFWAVDIDQQERSKHVFRDMETERDQLWAEAVVRWRVGEALHLSPEMEAVARKVQEEHRARHPWEGMIADYLEQEVPAEWMKMDLPQREAFRSGGLRYDGALEPRRRVCAAEIWCEALGRRKGDMTQRDTRTINGLLERAQDWENIGPARAGKPYGLQRCFERAPVTD